MFSINQLVLILHNQVKEMLLKKHQKIADDRKKQDVNMAVTDELAKVRTFVVLLASLLQRIPWIPFGVLLLKLICTMTDELSFIRFST